MDEQILEQNERHVLPPISSSERRELLARVRGQLNAGKRCPVTPERSEAIERLHKAGRYLTGQPEEAMNTEAIIQAISIHAALAGISPGLMAAAPNLTSKDGVEFSMQVP